MCYISIDSISLLVNSYLFNFEAKSCHVGKPNNKRVSDSSPDVTHLPQLAEMPRDSLLCRVLST
jgi:hypothetical protein